MIYILFTNPKNKALQKKKKNDEKKVKGKRKNPFRSVVLEEFINYLYAP